eukprot:Rhum_TRINITY_DN14408_c41_g1::Rhum_TRINITY_DN14408_c41_g1_i1::g.88721::m.88721
MASHDSAVGADNSREVPAARGDNLSDDEDEVAPVSLMWEGLDPRDECHVRMSGDLRSLERSSSSEALISGRSVATPEQLQTRFSAPAVLRRRDPSERTLSADGVGSGAASPAHLLMHAQLRSEGSLAAVVPLSSSATLFTAVSQHDGPGALDVARYASSSTLRDAQSSLLSGDSSLPSEVAAESVSLAQGPPGSSSAAVLSVAKEPPCEHNQWDRVAKKKNSIALCCRKCGALWKTRLSFFEKCARFYAGHCDLGDACPHPHIYSRQATKYFERKLKGTRGKGAPPPAALQPAAAPAAAHAGCAAVAVPPPSRPPAPAPTYRIPTPQSVQASTRLLCQLQDNPRFATPSSASPASVTELQNELRSAQSMIAVLKGQLMQQQLGNRTAELEREQ